MSATMRGMLVAGAAKALASDKGGSAAGNAVKSVAVLGIKHTLFGIGYAYGFATSFVKTVRS